LLELAFLAGDAATGAGVAGAGEEAGAGDVFGDAFLPALGEADFLGDDFFELAAFLAGDAAA